MRGRRLKQCFLGVVPSAHSIPDTILKSLRSIIYKSTSSDRESIILSASPSGLPEKEKEEYAEKRMPADSVWTTYSCSCTRYRISCMLRQRLGERPAGSAPEGENARHTRQPVPLDPGQACAPVRITPHARTGREVPAAWAALTPVRLQRNEH